MTRDHLTDFLSHAAALPSPTQILRNRLFEQPHFKKAAVLLAVVPQSGRPSENEWGILLTRRSANLQHHAGQISLAGGGFEPQDADLTQTALRETEEETGIPARLWQTFLALPAGFTPSGYEVHTIPALCRNVPEIRTNPDEVAEAFFLPLPLALNPENYQTRRFKHNGQSMETPVLPYLHHDIWGLTAVILYGLAERYAAYSRRN
ncbi:coenzyme A pyrophosphatase [Neisseria chenwenguii]|uniref:Coenzyme A pyrophosphatase n=1 Tax=Neisseria chenwenguii TaxID=1853278 RepID=A0A220S3R4_9NEIS|nr:CoA pyrophosphatase [Neisseria chenwenguii]ASK28141.1 coenzyme A pyrophosphatase [Neisseria chenwenguii]